VSFTGQIVAHEKITSVKPTCLPVAGYHFTFAGEDDAEIGFWSVMGRG
jgi:hypothetical protein